MPTKEIVYPYKERVPDRDSTLTQTQNAIPFLEAFECKTEADYRQCGEWLTQFKGAAKVFEERRKSVTAPLNAVVKEINSWFKPLLTEFDKAERILKQKILDYQAAQYLERQRLAAVMAEQHRAGDVGALMASAAAAQATQPPQLDGVQRRRTMRWRVTDAAAVPRSWLVVDREAVNEALREAQRQGAVPEIPGIEFYEDTTIAAMAR